MIGWSWQRRVVEQVPGVIFMATHPLLRFRVKQRSDCHCCPLILVTIMYWLILSKKSKKYLSALKWFTIIAALECTANQNAEISETDRKNIHMLPVLCWFLWHIPNALTAHINTRYQTLKGKWESKKWEEEMRNTRGQEWKSFYSRKWWTNKEKEGSGGKTRTRRWF